METYIMKTKQLTLLSYFFEDFRVIDKIFKGTKQKLVSIDFDMPEEDEYLHLTDVDTFKNTVVASKKLHQKEMKFEENTSSRSFVGVRNHLLRMT